MNFWFLGQNSLCKLCLKCLYFRQNLIEQGFALEGVSL